MHRSLYRFCMILCLLSAVTFTACKQKQRIVYSTSPVEDKANNELFRDIIANELTFNAFSAKLNLGITSGTQTLSSKGYLRIVKDQAIQLSIQPLFGFEMFRLYINPDTLVVLDRMNKRYVMEPIESLKEQFSGGFDFYTLQSLFTNKLFFSGKKSINATDYNAFSFKRPSAQNYLITSKDADSGIEYSFTVNGDDRITFTHLMLPEKNYYMQWGYSDFVMMDNVIFPHRMNMTLSSKSRNIQTEFVFSDFVKDDSIQLTLNVPSNFSRVSLDDVIKAIVSRK